MGYLLATTTLIHEHHDHEEDIEFPFLAKYSDALSKVESRKEEHGVLNEILKNVEDLIHSFEKDGVFKPEEIKDAFTKLQDMMFPHLEKEEALCTAEWLRQNVDAAGLEDVIRRIEKDAQKGDPTISLPFMYYNLDETGKNLFWKVHMPWIVRAILFPFIFSKKHRDWWKYASFPPK